MTNRSGETVGRRQVLAGMLAGTLAGQDFITSAAAETPGGFVDKVVLVTGATSGIGAATVAAFASAGAKVAFNGRRDALGKRVEAAVRAAGGDVMYLKSDVRDAGQMEQFVSDVVRVTEALMSPSTMLALTYRRRRLPIQIFWISMTRSQRTCAVCLSR